LRKGREGGGEECMSMSIRVEHEVVRGKHMAVDIESNRIEYYKKHISYLESGSASGASF
jgi:hypothetical protein